MSFSNGLMRAIIAMIIVVSTSCGNNDNEVTEIREDVLNKQPFKSISDSIKRFPDEPVLYLQRAVLLSQNNQLDLATPDFKKAWEITQDENVAMEYISNLLLVNKVQEAVNLLRACSVKFPGNSEFKRRLGEIYSETENTDAALAQFNEILQQEPENFEAWYDKGRLLAKLKDTTAAIEALEKSFALQPISYTGITLANLFVERKDEKALAICNYLIARDSAKVQTDAVFTKGVFYAETGQPKLALEQFEECIRRDWKLTDAYIEKGIIYYQQKQFDSALNTLNLAITVSNTSADGYFWIGRCYEAMNNKDKAVENYQRALSLDRTFREASDRIRQIRNS